MSLGELGEWTLRAKCRDMEDVLFPESKDQRRVQNISKAVGQSRPRAVSIPPPVTTTRRFPFGFVYVILSPTQYRAAFSLRRDIIN